MHYVAFKNGKLTLYRNKKGRWVDTKSQAFGHKSKAAALNVASQMHDSYMSKVEKPTGTFYVEEG